MKLFKGWSDYEIVAVALLAFPFYLLLIIYLVDKVL